MSNGYGYGEKPRGDSITINPPEGYYIAEINPIFKKFKTCPKCNGTKFILIKKIDEGSTDAEPHIYNEACTFCNQTGYLKE